MRNFLTDRISKEIHHLLDDFQSYTVDFLIKRYGLEDQKLKASKPILGYTDSRIVKLDFDNMLFKFVKYWAELAMKRFKLKGFIILRSSKNCYHVIFDRNVSWVMNVSIVAWVALLSKNKGLIKWFLMQCIKGASTLRVTPKKEKPPPRIVYKLGCQENAIKDFSRHRQLIKRIYRSVH